MHRYLNPAVVAVVMVLGFALPVTPAAENDLQLASPESVGMSTARLQRINTYFQEYIDTNRIAGAVILVARQGKVVHYEAQGWRHKEENIPMTRDTIFALASMTKPIASTALMMLFAEGRFLLDDPISKWISEYTHHMVRVNADGVRARDVPEARPVTVRHVLTHTSGLTLSPEGKGLSEQEINAVTNHGERWHTLQEQVVGRMTVNNMITNHIGIGKPVYVRGPGYGFGLGFGVLTDPTKSADALSIGSYTWGGAFGTLYWADPVEDLIGIMMIQLPGHAPLNIRPMFSNVVTQAVVDSLADQQPTIMGYATPH